MKKQKAQALELDKNTLEMEINLRCKFVHLMIIMNGLDLGLQHPKARELSPSTRELVSELYDVVRLIFPDHPEPECLKNASLDKKN